jgi:chromosome segregation ATPase
VKEKEEASGDLRKHVNKLESVNRTVQSERSKREKLLQQKEAEWKKRKEDIARWDEQMAQMSEETLRVMEEKARLESEAAKQVTEYRTKIADEQTEMKALDEDIKVKGSRIKKLEEERRRLEDDDNDDGKELDRLEKERERFWEVKMANLRAQYTSLISVHSQVCRYLIEHMLSCVNDVVGSATVPRGARTSKMGHSAAIQHHISLCTAHFNRFRSYAQSQHPPAKSPPQLTCE